jgi:hypothetical protein
MMTDGKGPGHLQAADAAGIDLIQRAIAGGGVVLLGHHPLLVVLRQALQIVGRQRGTGAPRQERPGGREAGESQARKTIRMA